MPHPTLYRKMSASDQQRLGQILSQGDEWKKMMDAIPRDWRTNREQEEPERDWENKKFKSSHIE